MAFADALVHPTTGFSPDWLSDPTKHAPQLHELSIVDRIGHQRPLYRPLLVYAWLMAFRIRYETLSRQDFGRWDEQLRPWCDLLESQIGTIQTPASAADSAWTALVLHVAGKSFIRDAWTDLAADVFGRLARAQQPSGAFLAPDPAEHPELTWYHELAILHAAASYAVQAEDRTIAGADGRATDFHLHQTQPDHATTQPWGLFAFIWNESTRPLADTMLHTLSLREPGALDGVSLILLSDCLYCLRLFL